MIETIKEFTKDKYHIDVLKVEVPVLFQYVKGFTEDDMPVVYSQTEAADYFKKANDAATRPYIYLSAGVPADLFRKELIFAGKHGANYSGILGGRATWRDGVAIYGKQGEKALLEWLDTQGKENIDELNNILKEYAVPWYSIYGGLDNIEVFDIDVME